MAFAAPWWLAAGIVVLALGIGYLIAQRRRRRNTVKFANLELLDKVAPKRPGWWRHIPTALILVGLLLLTVALAGPTADAKEPRNRAVVMLDIDVSLSMEATDVPPNRLDAAKEAAHSFVDELTPGVNLGIVSFAGIATVLVSPTTDRTVAHQAIDGLNSTNEPPPARRSSPACRPSTCSPSRSPGRSTAVTQAHRRPASC